MQTIAEMPEFIRRAEKVLGSGERQALIEHLAESPKAGVLIQGTGGIRKLRWAREGSGKSSGARVIYYFHNERRPLYLLTIFGKGEKANLTQAERNELAKLVKLLVQLSERGK
ncbi:MAG: addiction module toxin RelE [Nevskiales bacterium]|nr:addiction module toxin RelE [Nevskiales bacterium]